MVLLQGLQDSPEQVHSLVCMSGLEPGFRHTSGMGAPGTDRSCRGTFQKQAKRGSVYISPAP